MPERKEIEPVMNEFGAMLAVRPYAYGLEPRREFPGGLTPENTDIWYAAAPRPCDLAKIYAQHARNQQRQTLMSLQLAATDATTASDAAFRANAAVMRALRQPGVKFPVMRTKPVPGEPLLVNLAEDRPPEGWMTGKAEEGFEFGRVLHWFDKYPNPPESPMMSEPKCGESSPLKLAPHDPLHPHYGQFPGERPLQPEEKMDAVQEAQQKEYQGMHCDREGPPGSKLKCPEHGNCWCQCGEEKREHDAYGYDYTTDYAEGDAPLPFLPPKPMPMDIAQNGPMESEAEAAGAAGAPAPAQAGIGSLAVAAAVVEELSALCRLPPPSGRASHDRPVSRDRRTSPSQRAPDRPFSFRTLRCAAAARAAAAALVPVVDHAEAGCSVRATLHRPDLSAYW